MNKIFTFLTVSLVALIAAVQPAQAQTRQGPYIYTYPGDPVGLSTSIMNPPIGAIVIDPNTGNTYIKLSPLGSNATYGVGEISISGSNTLVSGSIAATGVLTLASQPTAGDAFTVASASGTQTYTYVASLTGTTNQILISGSLQGTIANTGSAFVASGTGAGWGTSGTNVNVNITGTSPYIYATAKTSGTAGNAIVTTGSFTVPTADFWGAGTLSGGVAASGTNTIFQLPANSGNFVFTGADILFVSGATITTAPTVAIYSGTISLSGSTALTGTTTTTTTHLSPATLAQLVNSGTAGTTISIVTTNSGTTGNVIVKPVFKGYMVP